jgi:hypothetical protein
MLSFLKAYMPKPLHPPSICTHDFLYIHPLMVKLCKALQAKLHENMRHTDPPSTLPSRCGSLIFTQPQSSGFILHIEHLKKFPSGFGGHLQFVSIPHIRRFLHLLLQSGRDFMFISRHKPSSTLIFFISYIDLMITITSVTSALPNPECDKKQVN